MKRRRRGDLLLLLSGVFLCLLSDAGAVRSAAAEGLRLCAASVVPALFPMMAVSALLVSQGFGEWASPLFSSFMGPLFRLPGTAGSALALGLAGGYPLGARGAADLFRRGLLTREEAERLLTFCNNGGAAFFLAVLGEGIFHSARVGLWLFLLHLLSALLTGLLFRGRERPARRSAPPSSPGAPEPFFSALVEAVTASAGATVRLCGFVVFFRVLTWPLGRLKGPLAPALTGSLELFSLLPLLTPDRTGFILAAALSGWGGVSVLAQTGAVLEGTGLSLSPCVRGKAVQAALSGLLAALAAPYVL